VKTRISLLITIAISLVSAIAAPEANSLSAQAEKSPQQAFPGYIARVYNHTKEFPTQALAVVQSGNDFKKNFKPLAENELRGKVADMDLYALATGYIILDQDTEVLFVIQANNILINKKDAGKGTFRIPLKKGKYPIEIWHEHGKGQGEFSISDAATNKSVVFYTGEMLTKELNRSERVERKMYKTVFLNEAPGAVPAAK
jgi:hypothetical protein